MIRQSHTGWSDMQPRETRAMMRDASKQMGGLVRSTLGPLGLDKMVVRRMEDGRIRGFVSNDGSALVEEFEGETDHPIAQYFISATEDHEADYGDGSTTMVLLAAELLGAAMDLTEEGVHPTDIVEGFSIGAQRVMEVWDDGAIELSDDEGELDRAMLREIAVTGMTNGRDGAWRLNELADTVVDAVLRVSDPEDGTVRLNRARTVAVPGGSVSDSELLDGAVLPLEWVVGEHLLPATGPVLLVDGSLKARQPKSDVKVSAEGAMQEWDSESVAVADAVARTGAVAVVATGDADMAVAKALRARGAVLARNVQDHQFAYIAAATGATPRGSVYPTSTVDEAVLGHATVSFRETGRDEPWVAFESDDPVPACALIIRGGTEAAAEEAERRVRDGKNALRAAMMTPRALPAGGAADMAAARAVRELAPRFDGREQLAVDRFADVLESVPRTLAANAGLDQIRALAQLRSLHDAGYDRAAVSKDGLVVSDVTADGGGLDAFQVRLAGLVRAVEFVTALVRVDSVLVDERPPSATRVLGDPKYRPGEIPDADIEDLEQAA